MQPGTVRGLAGDVGYHSSQYRLDLAPTRLKSAPRHYFGDLVGEGGPKFLKSFILGQLLAP